MKLDWPSATRTGIPVSLVLQFMAISNHSYSVEGRAAVDSGSWSNMMIVSVFRLLSARYRSGKEWKAFVGTKLPRRSKKTNPQAHAA